MELFTKGTTLRLRSCHEKYLYAVNDEKSVRQNSDGTSQQSVWTVEMVPRKPNFIRLKSCYGKYLTASESSFLMGMTGEKVIQTPPFRQAEHEGNWEPIRDDLSVKFMSWNGNYLRANGGSPPWKNSVTHDQEPYTPATKKWILWTVEIVESGSSESIGSDLASVSSISSSSSKIMFTSSMSGTSTPKQTERKNSMKMVEHIFATAKSVRLRSSAHEKYLSADEDEESVTMGHKGSSKEARWEVELVSEKVIRLKSCYGGYLTALDERFLLGATGHKVVQSRRIRVGEPAGEWEPVKEGVKVKMRSRKSGTYLRANGGMPPWRNTVTHDSPNQNATQSWMVWDVDVVEIM